VMRKFLVWCPERGETESDAKEIAALASDDAAEQWASDADADSADYDILKGSVQVCVRERGIEDVERFDVSGEAVPQYYAKRIS